SSLVTHRFPIEDAPEAYELITGKKDEPFLGVLLTYSRAASDGLIKGKSIHVLEEGAQRKRKSSAEVGLGVLGAGNFARATLLPVLKRQKGINLVGIASASGLSAQHAARKFGFAYATSDVNAILNDPKVNAIAILTRHDLHASQTLAGLRAGKHVFCEKPLAINQDELNEIEVELGKPEAPLLMVGFNRRFAPMATKMKAFLDECQEPMVMHYRVNAGFLPSEHWLHDLEQGGGRIIGEGCHFVDFLTWLVGQPPVSAAAHGLPDAGRYSEDNVVMTFGFPDGSVGTVTYLANGDKSVPKERVEVFTGGRVVVMEDYRKLELIHGGRRRVQRARLRQDKGHKAEWQAFTKAITDGKEPPIRYPHIFGGMRATIAALEALRRGEKREITG
ncbi:MAG: hypothetical protein E3J88_05255, partial [Anaerolineales bacterium]